MHIKILLRAYCPSQIHFFYRHWLLVFETALFLYDHWWSLIKEDPQHYLHPQHYLMKSIGILVNVWLDSDMAFKLELSKTQLSSAFTPMDVKLFHSRSRSLIFVLLLIACEISMISSSFNRLCWSLMWRVGGSPSKYAAIFTAPSESICCCWDRTF